MSKPIRILGIAGSLRRQSYNRAALRGGRVSDGSDFLVAAGRTPNTQSIGLDLAGVELDRRGYIMVNERLEATAPSTWAMGECAGSPQFTHVADDDYRIVRDNLNGGNRTTQNRLVPFCMFIDPELARVGLNESEAQRSGINYRLVKLPMAAEGLTTLLADVAPKAMPEFATT